MDPIQFDEVDLEFQTRPVRLGSNWYGAVEANGDASIAYRKTLMKGARFEQEKRAKASRGKKKRGQELSIREVPTGTAELEAVLVGHCLFHANYSEKSGLTLIDYPDKPVGEAFVRSLPSRIVKPIYNWIKEVSQLGEEDEEDEEDVEEANSPASP